MPDGLHAPPSAEGSASDEAQSSERVSSERDHKHGWVDTHCHVHDAGIPGGAVAAVAEAHDAGVATMITVGTDRATSLAALDLADVHPDVHATVGLHPHEAKHGIDTIIDLIDRPGIVAVGEAGLDYHYDHSPRDAQRDVFAAQIALAHRHELPLVIHTREAWPDTFAILDAEGVPARTIFHCFTGGPTEARGCLDRGAFVSFSGIVSFPSATDVREAAALCPPDRMLVETDSPYLAPVPHRGQRNRPAWVPLVGACLASLRGVDVEDVRQQTAGAAELAFPGLAP
jgi:TatD DNase family protein